MRCPAACQSPKFVGFVGELTASWYSSVELTAIVSEGKRSALSATATENFIVTKGRMKIIQKFTPSLLQSPFAMKALKEVESTRPKECGECRWKEKNGMQRGGRHF